MDYNEEDRFEMEQKIEELKDIIELSGGNMGNRLWGQKTELESRKETLKQRIANARKRLRQSDQQDYICDLVQHSEVIETQKEGLAERPHRA